MTDLDIKFKLYLALVPIQDEIDLKAAKEDGDPAATDDAIRGATMLAEAGIMHDLGINKTDAATWVASLIRLGLDRQICACNYGRNHPQHLTHEGFCSLHYESTAKPIDGEM